jgi:DNA-binding SARP family transcriptional activator/predicted ATPase
MVRLFGVVSVEHDGRRVQAGGPRQAAVLSVLALSVGRPVPVSRLIDGVWGDEPPNSVGNAVQVYVSSLRRLLRPLGLSISRTGRGYTLEASIDDVDVERFQRQAAEGRAALRSGDSERAYDSLQRAAELWAAEPFAGIDDAAFVSSARASLLATGLAVAVDRGVALCSLGRAEEATAAAEALLAEHQFHEPAWELLMRSLYHSGRQHDALLAFGRARRTFVEELGLDPPTALVELERQILDRTVPALAAPAGEATASATPTPVRLPAAPGLVLGRTEVIEQVQQLLTAGARVVTLVGLGGVGKTTVALATGHRLADAGQAVVFVDLADVNDPSHALERMCGNAGMAPGAAPATTLAEADPDVLFILDNAEQVTDVGMTVAQLLAGTTRLRLLVTSRVPLRIRAESLLPIRPFDTSIDGGVSQAGQLFSDRAGRVRRDLHLIGDEEEVMEICRLAGGIPLAIEIAAGRLGHLTLQALADRLRGQPTALLDTRGAADLPDRQQSLRVVLDATTSLLSPGATSMAGRLCVLKGPFTLALVELLCDNEPGLLDGLGELVDASLVTGPDTTGRYRMPVPVGEYFDIGRDEMRGRVLRAVLAASEGSTGGERMLDDSSAVTVACQAASTVSDASTAARLVIALQRYWRQSSRLTEALQCCEEVLRLDLAVTDRIRVQLILGQFTAMLNRPDAGEQLELGILLADADPTVDRFMLVNSWCYLGAYKAIHGDPDGARATARRVGELAQASGDLAVAELARDFEAFIAARVGDFDVAARLVGDSLEEVRHHGDGYRLVELLSRNAENLLELGRLTEADALLVEATELTGTTPIGPLMAKLLAMRAAVDLELDRPAAAIGAATEALRLTATRYPDPHTQAAVLRILAAARASVGDMQDAGRCEGAAAAVLRRAGLASDSAALGPIDRRLAGLRHDTASLAAARIAAHDPAAVVATLLTPFER